MRVLYIHAKGEIGGSDISLLTMLKNIDKKKFSPNLIVAKKGPFFNDYKKYCEHCEKLKFSVLKSPDNLLEFLKIILWFVPSIFLIWNVIRKWKIDLVHVNTIVVPSAVIAAKLAGKPVIVHKREIIVSNKVASKFLDWLTLLFSDKVIAISNAVKNSSLEALRRKMVVIYNGVDVSEIPDSRQDKLRKSYKISDDVLLVGIFSRIESWKGQDIVIEAMPEVVKKIENIRLVIFGKTYTQKGEVYLEKLKNTIKKLNLEKFVFFAGIVKDVNKIYNEFDVVVLPSKDPEPLGRVLIESMAAGRAVIATDLGGSKECVINNKTGLLIKENDIKSMENALIRLLSNNTLRQRFGKLGRERAKELFDMKKIIKNIESLYDKLII